MAQRRGRDEVDHRSNRQRIYRDATSGRDGRWGLGLMALAVSVFLLLAAISARQATAPGPARNILESGIAVTTEIEQVIAEDHDTLRDLVESDPAATFMIPGYPLDVVLTKAEIVTSTDAQLRQMVLERSSGLVYAGGLEAFDRTGRQSFGRFSSQGLLEVAVGQVSKETHDRASFLATMLVLASVASACFVVLAGDGWGRLRGLGLAMAGGTLPGLLTFGLAWLAVSRTGGDDPFVIGLREIIWTVLEVPLRNYLLTFGLGVFLSVVAIGIGMLDSGAALRAADPIE